ncbi:LOW QUALITY PROTEIN: AP20 region protein 1 [Cebus imitator]|uniref:LOW QUALITY PROTEIN: AP20 region protein 1 n=1 Tax=Cebus imitator TaxID=2715852 RepID=UPI00080A35DB|nr:LOW QUALITY PROTEIN: AP20 region protein 1 [Cebus imitator]
MPFSGIRIHMKTMKTRERCKLSRTGPESGNVIKRLLCARTFHTRIGGDLTHGIINRGRLANAEQMGLQGSAPHFNIFPLDLWTHGACVMVSLAKNKATAFEAIINMAHLISGVIGGLKFSRTYYVKGI